MRNYLRARARSGPACSHSVHFYDHGYPAQAAADFIATGLHAGDTCVVMLVAPARCSVEQALNARGIATGADSANAGRYAAIDTDAALEPLLIDGRLDLQRAQVSLAALLRAPLQDGAGPARRVRLVGNPAPALFAAGRQDDAIALEALVDHLAEVHGAAVFCAYPVQQMCRDGHTQSLLRISAEHSALVFPDRLWADALLAQPGATWPSWPAADGRTPS